MIQHNDLLVTSLGECRITSPLDFDSPSHPKASHFRSDSDRIRIDVKLTPETSDVDPLGNPLVRTVDVVENHFYVQFEVAFTPDLGDAKVKKQHEPALGVRAIPMPDTVIDTSTGKQLFNFTIKNTGNVKLYGADMMDGNLHMDFAEFKQMGDGYFDSDADPGIDLFGNL